VLPRDRELVLYTLRTSGEVRDAGSIDELKFTTARPRAEEVKLARQVLNSLETSADLSTFTDHYEERLKEMLQAKRAEAVTEEGEPAASAPVNLMDALRKSLDQVSGAKKRPARAASRRSVARVLPYRRTPHRASRRAS